MQKLSFLYLVQCSLFDTNSRRLINVAFFVSFRATKNYKVSVAVKTCFQLPNWHDVIFGIFPLLQTIRVSIFYGLELVFKVSFRVRNRFRIRINNVMSVWQLATTVAAILVLPIRHSGGFIFVAGWAIHLYIDQWLSRFTFQVSTSNIVNTITAV